MVLHKSLPAAGPRIDRLLHRKGTTSGAPHGPCGSCRSCAARAIGYRNDWPFDGRPPAACNELLLTHPQGRGTLRRFERAIAMTSAIPPPRISLLIAVVNPAICLPVILDRKSTRLNSSHAN